MQINTDLQAIHKSVSHNLGAIATVNDCNLPHILEQVVSYLGIKEINHPVYYRNLLVEKDDPFYDRDYNLCILCGRCVRMCQEVRLANVLAFNQRGRYTVIGPAFDRTHIEAGCEFCGACVSVCPTGSLAEKSNKWDGVAEREEITTCSFCGVGCQMRIQIKDNKVMGVLPADDFLVNNDQLCVKGRFCVSELVNQYNRLAKPQKAIAGTMLEIKWDEAITIAAEKLSACPPQQFAMFISPNCTNEDLYVAQKFTRLVMGSHHVDTSARLFYGRGFNAYLNLMKKSVPLSEIDKADVILAVGLDLKYGRSVVGVKIRKAIANGAKIITINTRDHSLALSATAWIQPKPGEEIEILDSIFQKFKNGKTKASESDVSDIAELLKSATNPVILIGSDFMQYSQSADILQRIEQLADNLKAGILSLPAQNNLYGSLVMGAYPELLPGGILSSAKQDSEKLQKVWNSKLPINQPEWTAEAMTDGKKLNILYLVGEVPLQASSIADFTIYQNIYPLNDPLEADLFLPAVPFTEADGSFLNGEGRLQKVRKAANTVGEALPDWQILSKIAQKMGKKGFDFKSAADVQQEISQVVPDFKISEKMDRSPNPLPNSIQLKSGKNGSQKTSADLPYTLTISMAEHVYRGMLITEKVDGLKILIPEDILLMNQLDAEKEGISEGDAVEVHSDLFEKIWHARFSDIQPQGTLKVVMRQSMLVNPNPHFVNIRRKDV